MTMRLYSGGEILLSAPPQTAGNSEEAALIDLVSTHPLPLRGTATDWKTKHDGAGETYGAAEAYGVERSNHCQRHTGAASR